MFLTDKEIIAVRECLSRIERKDAKGMTRYYATNQLDTSVRYSTEQKGGKRTRYYDEVRHNNSEQ
jgi:hypothetical protein